MHVVEVEAQGSNRCDIFERFGPYLYRGPLSGAPVQPHTGRVAWRVPRDARAHSGCSSSRRHRPSEARFGPVGIRWAGRNMVIECRYELRRGDELVVTGHFSRERPLQLGQQIEIAGHSGTVRTAEPILGERELRLVVQLAEPENI